MFKFSILNLFRELFLICFTEPAYSNLRETLESKKAMSIGRTVFQIPNEILVEMEEWINFFNRCIDVSKQNKGEYQPSALFK